jgi:hypothetical protein
MTGGIRCADHATTSIRTSWHYFANKLGRSVCSKDNKQLEKTHSEVMRAKFMLRLSMSAPVSEQDEGIKINDEIRDKIA